ncbi:hypothetical protein FRC02_003730, partial [Tulasnella sp. 418]
MDLEDNYKGKSTFPSYSRSRAEKNFLFADKDGPTRDRPLNRDDDTPFWRAYMSEAGKYDKELIDGWNRTFDNFLVFSGLFASVNTAFIIETYKLLEPDHVADTANMMRLFLKHRNDDHQFSDEELVLSATGPRKSDIQINRIFFASLWCSLLAALTAVQGKQWLSRYQNHGAPSLPDSVRACNRQRKLDGFERWRFWLLANFLMLILQLSLALFVAGVMAFLWDINIDVGGAVMAFTLIGSLVYIVPLVIAIRHSYSPYQTHLSHYLRKPFLFIVVNYLLPTVRETVRRAISWSKRFLSQRIAVSYTPPIFNLFDIIPQWITKASKRTIDAKKVSEMQQHVTEMQQHVTEMTRAECLGWLFEQVYQTEVVLCTLSGVPSLPPDHILAAFEKRPGLLSRLTALYSSGVEEQLGKQRILNPEATIITGIALFHVLKAHSIPGSTEVELSLSKHRVRSLQDQVSSDPTSKDIFQVLAIVICCIEMLLPDSQGAHAPSFKECVKHISGIEGFSLPVTIFIPAPNVPNTTLTDLNVTVLPSGLFLDAVIASAVRHIRDDSWRADWYCYYDISDLLKTLNNVLSDDPSRETISHTAIVMAAVQLARR